ncbi:Protein of unknown function [Sinomicrobium oceani]|uniref:DinB superfamily protein n=1 Tax=Sinomicrobium oceani TaxID=1150368 RepID=A0A1K1QD45_9FLAO|nr:DUF1572 family protein [Sinomicrobium oceani]SFW57661.1 Protein of unknown function [Sinomicrobium oceani]
MEESNYLESVRKLFEYYKKLGEKAMEQVPDPALFYQPDETSNNIAVIVKHLSGNMRSRWTDFLTSDGEKEWRDRDGEFTDTFGSREILMQAWEAGWHCLLGAIGDLGPADLDKTVYIRNEGHTVTEAINRQLAHVPYHIGQIVYIAKMQSGNHWHTLSIARNASADYNRDKFRKERAKRFFTDTGEHDASGHS